MKITEVSTIAVAEPGGRRYVIVKLSTDEGISGYGEAPAGPDPETAVAAISRETAPVRGQDPARLLFLDQELRRSGASPASRAAVNVAALDILARSANAPLYEFLGGPTRNKARAMAVVEGKTAGELRDAVLKAKDAGHRAFSIPLTMPNGNERGRVFYTAIRSTFDSLRQAAGSECDFVLDCGGQTTPGEALSIADRMEEFHLFWMDEPCGDLNAAAQASISKGSVTPVGFGRSVTENSRFQDLLREDAIDVLRPDIALNGITTIRKAAAIAETYYVAVAPYHRGGPIGTAAGIHIAASLPNSFVQETPFTSDADRKARSEIAGGWDERPREGFFELLQKPGLGLDIDDRAIRAHRIAG